MRLSTLTQVYEHTGPFLVAYLEPERPDFPALRAVELRWRALAEELSADRADASTIEAVEAELARARPGELASRGLAVVAAGGEVLLAEALSGPVGGDAASWSAVPDLGPYVRANGNVRRQVMVVVDKVGADVYIRDTAGFSHEELAGEAWPVHRVRGAGWDQYRYQRGVDETIDRNARMVAEEIVRLVGEVRPSIVLLAGEVEARENVHHRLPNPLAELVTVTDRGSRHESDRDILEEALVEAAWVADRARQRELIERFGTREAHGLAVQGVGAVCRAFRLGAVEELIIAIENPDTGGVSEVLRGTLAAGPEPSQVAPTAEELRRGLVETGADPGHDTRITDELADAVLIRAGACTGASFDVVTAAASGLTDGVGALLRFPLPPDA